ncbi:Membrane-bound lysozyme-inhibitor of c-type lysozyme [Thiorhodovibrio litoralis]|nr:hypothetical protein [Thiorhodovibrio winogradskyi]WPL12249.1 Membrane-bound lysozyme-inhibitor of c-type lysozyme [Thiorhodovibrio litoralis]
MGPAIIVITLTVVAVSSSFIAASTDQDTAETARSSGVAEAGQTSGERSRESESAAVETTQPDLQDGTYDWPTSLDQYQYVCDSGLVLISAYDPEEDSMWVEYRGQTFALRRLRSGSGAKFGGTDVPWGWWNKGNEGLVFGYADDGSDSEILDRCSAAEANDAAVERDPGRRWSLELHSDFIALLDCMDCGDDVGAVLECRGQGKPARLSILWAAVDTDGALDAALALEVGNQVFEHTAETTYAGQVGQFPQIRIGPDDPMIAALNAGSTLHVSFAGAETSIGLNGFEAAFAEFDRACPWRRDQSAGETEGDPIPDGSPVGTGEAASDQPRWMLNEHRKTKSGVAVTSLSFGVPETDALAFQATCAPGGPEALIDAIALLDVDVDEKAEGQAAELVIATADLEIRLKGQVSKGRATYPGILVSVGPRHPLWSVLESGDLVSLSSGQGPGISLPVTTSSDRIAEFLRSCSGS